MGRKAGDLDSSGRSKRKRLVEKTELEDVIQKLETTIAVLTVTLGEMSKIRALEVDGAGQASRGLKDLAAYTSNVTKALTSPWSTRIPEEPEVAAKPAPKKRGA